MQSQIIKLNDKARQIIMTYIVEKFRQWFCKHELKYEEKYVEYEGLMGSHSGTKVYVQCKKCGYHKSYWKWQ